MVIGKIYFITLAIAFIIHNIEECLLFGRTSSNYLKIIGSKLNNFYVFLNATILLDIIVICVFLLYYKFPHEIFSIAAIVITYGMLINAIQHLCASIIYKKIMPGVITSIFFLIPTSTLCLIKIYSSISIGFLATACYIISSLVFMILLIYLSLWLGYIFIKSIYIIGGKNG